MTGTKEPLSIAGREVAAHLRERIPALTRRVVARLVADLPVYAQLPREEVGGDIAGIVQHNLRLFAVVLDRRRPVDDAELAAQRDSAAQRAEEGVPLDAILAAYQIGVAMSWAEVSAGAGPDDLAHVQETVRHVLDFERRVLGAVSAAYLEVRRILDSEEHSGRHALLTALLSGYGLDELTGPRPAARYVAMTLALTRHPDEGCGGPGAAVATRRKVRRVRATLDRFAGEPTLTALDGSGGTALLPVAADPPWEALRELVAAAGRAAGTTVTAAASVVDPAGVPAAVAQGAEIVELVARTGRPPGLYRLADVLLDYQLSRPSEALTGLADLLAPLAAKPDLLRTLEEYLRHGLNRRATAAALHVQPNTVDYRLRRITALTGVSPTRPTDLPHLTAALVARRTAR
ncbi:PucR family transcriptional regulator [Actinocatenispora rupis]|uniref:Transcriptional regulator n=1 Tax=Actinocatenispora rupis TaxID=519421 RepID=A0A8J3NDY0_9ACTN|nr:helix-turn-helix domain-containing protein [Actinocatenispora rupis]GID15754.1 transcriptional regulator [Actinocatenispora rupis]